MALDRFVRFRGDKPSSEEVKKVLVDFLGSDSIVTESNRAAWFFVTLPGMVDDRWFEVCCIHKDSIDVITRQADNFTNAVALGFATKLALEFDGWLDSDDKYNFEKIVQC